VSRLIVYTNNSSDKLQLINSQKTHPQQILHEWNTADVRLAENNYTTRIKTYQCTKFTCKFRKKHVVQLSLTGRAQHHITVKYAHSTHVQNDCYLKLLTSSQKTLHAVSFNAIMGTGNYTATSNRSWYTDCWWVGCYIWYSEEGTGRGRSPPRPLLAVHVTAHPSTASVPIIILLYNGPLLCCRIVMCPLTGQSSGWPLATQRAVMRHR